MQEMDCIEVLVEKESYANEGIHKGMHGWICDPRCIEGYWLVNFPRFGEREDIASLVVKEEDLQIIPVMNVRINEQISAHFDNAVSSDPKDISDYLI